MKRYAGLLWLLPLLTKRFRVLEGLENIPKHGPCILAGNHVGSPDPIFIGAATYKYAGRSATFISYDRAVHAFGERRAYEWLGMIKKIEERPGEALPALRRELELGNIVGIFPEGMRNAAPFLLPGKTGAARLAHWTGAPVVPFGFNGPSTWTFNQGLRASLAFRRDLSLRIGKPHTFPVIDPNHLTKEQLLQTTRTIMAAIGELAGRPSPY
jgi:1-acyl-sn-glycerol-3-phosphate acyltransferase